MGSETPRTVRDPQATPKCPACGQPRETVAKRHKVMGAWVPEWEVQPCRNPRCPLYVRHEGVDGDGGGGDDGDGDDQGGQGSEEAAAEVVPGVVPGGPPDEGTEAATTQVTGKNGETGRSPATG